MIRTQQNMSAFASTLGNYAAPTKKNSEFHFGNAIGSSGMRLGDRTPVGGLVSSEEMMLLEGTMYLN